MMTDAELTGTTHPGRLRIIVKVLSLRPDLLTPAETAKLAAAKRLSGGNRMNVTVTWHNANPNTIWAKLAEKLGREPTNAEAAAEVRRILAEVRK